MKLFSGVLAFFFAFAISGVAALFSITGLATLFAGAFWPVIVMGGVLEAGKLMVAGWLHANWYNKNVSVLLKGYLCAAIVALMLITSVGIYGYLAKGFLEQQTPLGAVGIQVAQKEQQITTDQENIKRLNDRQAQLDAAVNSLISQSQVVKSQSVRAQQKKEREQIAIDLSTAQKNIDRLSNELVPLKLSTNDVEAKLGPIKYVADLFGWTKPDIAVRMVILILMFAFDPLAVVLILAGLISITEWMNSRKKPVIEDYISGSYVSGRGSKVETLPTEPLEQVKKLDTNFNLDVLPVEDDGSDKTTILSILQRNPDTVEEIIDTVIDWHEQRSSKTEL